MRYRVKKAPQGAFFIFSNHKSTDHFNAHQPNLLTNFNGNTFIAKPIGNQGHFGT